MNGIVSKALKILAGTIAILVLAALLIWNREIRTITSVRQVDSDGYLYEMTFKGSYDLDDVMAHDIDENTKLLEYVIGKLSRGLYRPEVKTAGNEFSCTSFQALKSDGDGWWFGRNYDFFKNPTLVVHNTPKNGYASLSVCDMSHFGYSLEKLPQSFASKALCLAAPYAPMDGINEKGLCISIMALPKMAAAQNTEKHDVGTTILMRLVLDRCATVQEAIELVNSVDVRHDQKAGSGYHYMIADAQGNAAVIEFDKEDQWKTMVVLKEEGKNYMHVTNHLLAPKYYTTVPDEAVGNPHSKSWWRYETVASYMEERGGRISFEQAQECLSLVHWKDLVWDNGTEEDTQYSNVYDQQELTLAMRPWNDYGTTYRFKLDK